MLDKTKLKPLPKNNAWLTEDTEVLTSVGWTPIQTLFLRREFKIQTANLKGQKVESHAITNMSKMQHKGEISILKVGSLYMEFWVGSPIEKCELFPNAISTGLGGYRYGRRKYNGSLYSLEIPNQAIFCRHLRANQEMGANPFVEMAQEFDDTIFTQADYEEGGPGFIEAGRYETLDLGEGLIGSRTKGPYVRNMFKSLSSPEYWICQTKW